MREKREQTNAPFSEQTFGAVLVVYESAVRLPLMVIH